MQQKTSILKTLDTARMFFFYEKVTAQLLWLNTLRAKEDEVQHFN